MALSRIPPALTFLLRLAPSFRQPAPDICPPLGALQPLRSVQISGLSGFSSCPSLTIPSLIFPLTTILIRSIPLPTFQQINYPFFLKSLTLKFYINILKTT